MEWTPEGLVRFAGSWWGAAALHAAAQLDLFTPLADSPMTSAELAKTLGCSQRGLDILVPALISMDLLVEDEGRLVLPPFSAQHLVSTAPGYMGFIVRHYASLMPRWARLAEAVRTGEPTGGSPTRDDTDRRDFIRGMGNNTRLMAAGVLKCIDLTASRRLLDLGGGPAAYSISFCLACPELRCTVYDLPTTQPIAEECVAEAGMAERIAFHAGDFTTDPIPGGFDTVWISHIIHSFDPEQNQALITRAVEALEPNGRIFVQDFYLENKGRDPLFPALFGLNMLVGTSGGRTYMPMEISAMLERAGCVNVTFTRLPGEDGVGIVMAEKPLPPASAQGAGLLARIRSFFGFGGKKA